MRFLKIINIAVLALSTVAIAFSQNVVIPDDIITRIEAEARATKKIIPLNKLKAEQNVSIFKTWISGSINLELATKRTSKRFKRTTYQQILKKDIIRLPTERIDIQRREIPRLSSIPRLQLAEDPTLQLERPITVLYREGPGYFRFQKMKEVKSSIPIEEEKAIQLAREFLIQNKFLKETDVDKISTAYVQIRYIEEDRGEGAQPENFVTQQDVVFERSFEGKPVINSKISVGIEPSTKEIILFKHYNWTPLETEAARKATIQELRVGKAESSQAIQMRLVEKVKRTCGKFTRAIVKQVIPAWFQTETGLVPVIAFGITIEHPSPIGSLTRDYLEVINLTGSDDLLYGITEPPKQPTRVKR